MVRTSKGAHCSLTSNKCMKRFGIISVLFATNIFTRGGIGNRIVIFTEMRGHSNVNIVIKHSNERGHCAITLEMYMKRHFTSGGNGNHIAEFMEIRENSNVGIVIKHSSKKGDCTITSKKCMKRSGITNVMFVERHFTVRLHGSIIRVFIQEKSHSIALNVENAFLSKPIETYTRESTVIHNFHAL